MPTIQPADFGPSLHQKSASGSSIITFGPAILQKPENYYFIPFTFSNAACIDST
jgi:hypothetical protein